MHQEVQVASIRHHPWDSITISIHRHEDGKVRRDEGGSICNSACSSSINCKSTKLSEVENIMAGVALRDVEALNEGLSKSPRVLGVVSVVAELLDPIRIEEDMNVIRLERPGSWLACAALFAQCWMRVCIR